MLIWAYDKAQRRPETTLPPVWSAATTPTHRRQVGRFGRVQPSKVLRPNLHGAGHEQGRGVEGRSSVARSEASKGRLRAVRRDRTATCTPSGRELAQQRPQKPHDTLPELPSETALGAGRAYAEAPMGSGDGVGRPARVLRSARGRSVSRGFGRDARAHLQPLGKTPTDLTAFRTLVSRLAARGSAGADQLVRMMVEP